MFQMIACEKKIKFIVYDNFGLAPLHYIARNGRVDFLFYLFYVVCDDIDFRIQTKNGQKLPFILLAYMIDRLLFIFTLKILNVRM